ncbi:MAG: DUF4160 domain-containing protein [Chromatiales bacterium]|nr:DUF4160 domain-containing protein [Chromatiales bacterium]
MPTVLRSGPYRLFWYSNEGMEPPHVHVDRAGCSAKFWLQPVAVARNSGFPSQQEVWRIQKLVRPHQRQFLEQWHEYFSSHR